MPVDKLIPRKLNSDIDAKLIDKASMIDALNLYAGDDADGGGGVLKNIKGNTAVAQSEADSFGDNSRVLGSVTDEKTGIVYFFVYSTQADYHGVWAYDPEGKLANDGQPAVRLIYRDSQFNFPSTGFVKGDIVHINSVTFPERGDEFDRDAIVFFTDNKNEPRKINAYRAYQAGGSEMYSNIYDTADFITACPKAPVLPITFQFDKDVNRGITNFKGTSGFQFAYQHVYIDGFESAVSAYSDVAFPPSVLQQGALTYASHDSYNRCILYIPQPGSEIKAVKILAKEGETGSFLLIDEVEVSSLYSNGAYVGTYSFYNDRITKGFSKVEVNKQFDSVPRKAKAQAVADNRLLYGNYLDGFDPVQVDCTAQVVYRQRPNDYVDFTVESNSFIGVHIDEENNSINGSAKRKSSGFTIDTSSLPDSVVAGTNILFKVSMTPDRNWHIYNCDNSYHQSRQIGEYEQFPISTDYNVDGNSGQNYELQNSSDSGLSYLRGEGAADGDIMLWQGKNDGIIQDGVNLQWKSKYQHPDVSSTPEVTYPAKIGTSAANPIILKGGTILFQVGFTTAVNIGSGFAEIAAKTFEELLIGVEYEDLTHKLKIQELGLIQSVEATLNHSLPIQNNSDIPQSYIGQEGTEVDLSRMIMAVMRKPYSDGAINQVAKNVPMGYVIFKEATAKFRIRPVENDFNSPTKKAFRLALSELTNVKPMTCYKSMFVGEGNQSELSEYPFLNRWGVLDPEVEFYDSDGNEQPWTPDSHFSFYGADVSVEDLHLETENGVNGPFAGEWYGLMLGMLTGPQLPGNVPASGIEILPENHNLGLACVFDGEGGPGGGPSRGGGGNTYDDMRLHFQGSVAFCTPLVRSIGLDSSFSSINLLQEMELNDWRTDVCRNHSPMWTGRIGLTPYDDTNFLVFGNTNHYPSTLPLLQNKSNSIIDVETPGIGGTLPYIDNINYPAPFEHDTQEGLLSPYSVNFNFLHSNVEIQRFISGSYSGDVFRSFKSNSNHDFGIVYYDQRGRRGFVNHLSTVFVPGFSALDRPEGSEGGPVSVALTLNHTPPSWAHNYKIVYGGNSTIDSFVQYSVPNAYIRKLAEEQEAPISSNIYVSLNYLQGNPISYTSSFGAKSVEGGINMYKFKEGDKLRVISTGPDADRTYYQSGVYEFDVINLIDVAAPIEGDVSSINLIDPSSGSEETESPRTEGQFLVLRDNQEAYGFRYQDVSIGGETNKWRENCIVEIYSPSKDLAEDEKFYYETSNTYNVITTPNDTLAHSPSTVILNKGDVWFRKGALNWKNDSFEDLIPSTLDEEAQPNFVSVFIESSTATDLHRSDFKGFGRVNLINDEAKEVRREASVTYSDKSNPESSKSRYTSFDINKLNYNDYDYSKGDITFISPTSGYIIVLQSKRASLVPMSKNILSDASGSTNLISSNVVLGEAIEQANVGGCDSSESVVERDDKIYYANKADGKVYLYSKGQGAKDISSNFIGASIRKKISSIGASAVRLIGGYDNVKEEYLLTIIGLIGLNTSGVTVVPQPAAGEAPGGIAPGGITGGPDDEENGLNITGFQVFVDTDGDGIIGINEFLNQTSVDTGDVILLGSDQIAVTPSISALQDIADSIVVSDTSEIANVLFDIGTSISAAGTNFDETDVLQEIISAYAASTGLDVSSPAGLSALIVAANLDPQLLGDGTNNGNTTSSELPININSNYDLIYQLAANGTPGFAQMPIGDNVDTQVTYGELQQIANVLGLEVPTDSVSADIDKDGLVTTQDLLIFLAAYGNAADPTIDESEVAFDISDYEQAEENTGDAG